MKVDQLKIHDLDKAILILDEAKLILTQTESLQANNGDNVFGRWIIFDNLIKYLAKDITMDADTGFCMNDLLASFCKHVFMINNLWCPCRGWCWQREKIDWQEARKFDCWCGLFLFFVVPCQFSQDIGKWPQNQILIPDWTYFHCPGATLVLALRKPLLICIMTSQKPSLLQ